MDVNEDAFAYLIDNYTHLDIYVGILVIRPASWNKIYYKKGHRNKGLKLMKEVTAAIIRKENRVLIAERAPGQNLAGKWELPGGKIEPGESPEECLKREIREELEVDIDVLDLFGESIYAYHSGTIKLMAFWCQWISGDFRLSVHSRIEWVTRQQLELYDFAPADIPLVERLKVVMG